MYDKSLIAPNSPFLISASELLLSHRNLSSIKLTDLISLVDSLNLLAAVVEAFNVSFNFLAEFAILSIVLSDSD